MSTQITVNAQIRRAEIEVHIQHCRNEAMRNLVEIGRWLNIAKKEGVVAHGEWTAWAQEHSGLSERNMQRAMQIAQELPEGSPLERLGVTKISALITLPAAPPLVCAAVCSTPATVSILVPSTAFSPSSSALPSKS